MCWFVSWADLLYLVGLIRGMICGRVDWGSIYLPRLLLLCQLLFIHFYFSTFGVICLDTFRWKEVSKWMDCLSHRRCNGHFARFPPSGILEPIIIMNKRCFPIHQSLLRSLRMKCSGNLPRPFQFPVWNVLYCLRHTNSNCFQIWGIPSLRSHTPPPPR